MSTDDCNEFMDMVFADDNVKNTPLGDRLNSGKPQWHLIDFKALEPMVRVMEYGANKYSPDNWKKGQNCTTLLDCLLRHTFALAGGEETDPESKVHHIGHILTNAMMLSYMIQNRPDLNDLPQI